MVPGGVHRLAAGVRGSRVPQPGGLPRRSAVPDRGNGLGLLAGPGRCRNTSNGALFSNRSAGDQAERSLAAGAWVASEIETDTVERDPCQTGPEAGRSGDDVVLVPPAPVELRVCERIDQPAGKRPTFRTGTLRDGVAEFAAKLSSGRTVTDGRGCAAPRGVTRTYTLVFRYEEGPPVRIGALIGCDPPLLGATVQAWEAPGTGLAARLAAIVASG